MKCWHNSTGHIENGITITGLSLSQRDQIRKDGRGNETWDY
jgi:hypothetical protein